MLWVTIMLLDQRFRKALNSSQMSLDARFECMQTSRERAEPHTRTRVDKIVTYSGRARLRAYV